MMLTIDQKEAANNQIEERQTPRLIHLAWRGDLRVREPRFDY